MVTNSGSPPPARKPAGEVIREARTNDLAALTRIAHAAKAHWGYPADWIERWTADLSIEPVFLSTANVWVVVTAGEIAAFCAVAKTEAGWEIDHMWVDPAFMGRGIGKRLFRHATQRAWRERAAPVLVESDPNAAGFYRRLGGSPAGSHPAPMPGASERSLPVFVFNPTDNERPD